MNAYLVLILTLAASAASACTITFEDEASATVVNHRLFQEVLKNKKVLESKGYFLRSVNVQQAPDVHAFLDFSEDHRYLNLEYHSRNVQRQTRVVYQGRMGSSVNQILQQLPNCRPRI
jgi:hypothetical protein